MSLGLLGFLELLELGLLYIGLRKQRLEHAALLNLLAHLLASRIIRNVRGLLVMFQV